MEQIRLIKEMRDECARQIQLRGTDEPIRPRYMVWENVPGAFSSNKGADFQAVLEETAKVAQRRMRHGKWVEHCLASTRCAVWGVPQRRKRIALVADFGGNTAPEILFERKSVPGDSEQGEQTRQETTETVGRGANPSSYTLKVRGGREIDSKGHKAGKGPLVQTELSGTLGVSQDQTLIQTTSDGSEVAGTLDASYYKGCGLRQGRERTIVYSTQACEDRDNPSQSYQEEKAYTVPSNPMSDRGQAVVIENHPADSRVQIKEDGVVQTLSGRMETGGGNVPLLMEQCSWDGSQVAPTLTSNNAGGNQRMPDKDNFNAVLTYGLDRASFNQGKNAQYDFAIEEEKIGTQVAKGPGAVCQSIVRRLTPLECERLQGFPDHWTDIGEWVDTKGKVHKDADSPRYKALGNSIALPFWQWMAGRMVSHLGEYPTMASLFDGIGGFPLVFSRCGCEPIWASEIEEFPIAVTKKHFPDMS